MVSYQVDLEQPVPGVSPDKIFEVFIDYKRFFKMMGWNMDETVVDVAGDETSVGLVVTTTTYGPPFTEKRIMCNASNREFKYIVQDNFGPFPMTSYTSHWQVKADGSGSIIVVHTTGEADVRDTDEMPGEDEPPFATRKGLETMLLDLYAGSIKKMNWD